MQFCTIHIPSTLSLQRLLLLRLLLTLFLAFILFRFFLPLLGRLLLFLFRLIHVVILPLSPSIGSLILSSTHLLEAKLRLNLFNQCLHLCAEVYNKLSLVVVSQEDIAFIWLFYLLLVWCWPREQHSCVSFITHLGHHFPLNILPILAFRDAWDLLEGWFGIAIDFLEGEHQQARASVIEDDWDGGVFLS